MMKAITWLATMSVGIAVLAPSAFATAPDGWVTEVDEAIAQAKEENKSVLLSFVGSDWCPPCIAMERNVFSKSEFVSKASENFILVHIDLPRGNPELTEKNRPYALKYRIEGFPSVVLLDADGREFKRFIAAQFPTVDAFLAELDRSLARKDFD